MPGLSSDAIATSADAEAHERHPTRQEVPVDLLSDPNSRTTRSGSSSSTSSVSSVAEEPGPGIRAIDTPIPSAAGALVRSPSNVPTSGTNNLMTASRSWELEEARFFGSRGPMASLWDLIGRLLDRFGVSCHRRELASQTYQMIRHGLYSSLLTMAMLVGILMHCYLWEGTSSCGAMLKGWALVSSVGFSYEGVFNRLTIATGVLNRSQGYGLLGVPPPPWCVGFHHIAALILTTSGLFLGLLVVREYGLDQLKVFVVLVIICNAFASIRCSKNYIIRLIRLEITARHAERRAFRERLANNVLTIAMFLEVPQGISIEQQATSVLENQTELQYEGSVFQEHPECCICSREFDAQGGPIRRTNCGHVFHEACLGVWLRRSLTCPLCRQDLGARVSPSSELPRLRQIGPAALRSSEDEMEQMQTAATPGDTALPEPRILPQVPQQLGGDLEVGRPTQQPMPTPTGQMQAQVVGLPQTPPASLT